MTRRLSRPEREKARERVERFVLRARRVLAHSLVRDEIELLRRVAEGTFEVRVEINHKTGDAKHWMKVQLPPEEAFESLVVRLRPFLLRDETVYWENVLDAVENLVGEDACKEVVDMESLRAEWNRATTGRRKEQAYYLMTENGRLTDFQLAEQWLNSHAVHDQTITSAVGQDATLNARYMAAAEVYSRACACVDHTLALIWGLRELELLEIDQQVFTTRVLADTEIEEPTRVFCVPLGKAQMPKDMTEMDLSEWRPVHEDPELMRRIREKASESQAESE